MTQDPRISNTALHRRLPALVNSGPVPSGPIVHVRLKNRPLKIATLAHALADGLSTGVPGASYAKRDLQEERSLHGKLRLATDLLSRFRVGAFVCDIQLPTKPYDVWRKRNQASGWLLLLCQCTAHLSIPIFTAGEFSSASVRN